MNLCSLVNTIERILPRERILTLKVTKENLDNCEVLMTVEIDDRQKDKLLQKAARRISRQVKIPGFRPGKAPYRVILNRFGIEAIQEEALEDLTQNVFKSALEEADLTPYAQASLDEIEWEPLVMKIKVPVEPVVELGDYQNIRLDVPEIEIAAEEIAGQLEEMRERYTTYSPVDRPAEAGDLVSVTIWEKALDSDEMLVEEDEDELTLEEPEPDDPEPVWLVHLTGLSAGEQKIFTHAYDEDYEDEDYAGKEIEFTVVVNTVKVKEEVELDDEFASLVGDFDTLDELKQKIEDELKAQQQRDLDNELTAEMIDQIIEGAKTIKWPLSLEERELDQTLEDQENRLKKVGLDINAYLKTQQKTLEEYREELRESVRNNLKASLALNKVIELENVSIDSAEVVDQAEMMVALSGGTQEAAEAFQSPAGLRLIASNLLNNKVRQRLAAIAKGEVEQETEQEEETASPEEEEEATEAAVVEEEASEELAPVSEEAETNED
jgi:trigger factor